jgi:hypothetical protein
MTTYGVLPEGFSRKPLDVILAEREEAMIAAFGPGVVQTSQSPLGAINGILALIESDIWALVEDAYQSVDIDQAEGNRLDIAARLRLLTRLVGESDEDFRQAITNQGIARVDEADFYRAVIALDGVIWAKIYSNDTGAEDANGQPRNSVSVAALGGEDSDIAAAAWQYIIPGITAFGNVSVPVEVAGFCRTIKIVRPTVRRVRVSLDLTKTEDRSGCPPPSNAAIAALLEEMTTGVNRPANGVDASLDLIRREIECLYSGVSVDGVEFAFDLDEFAEGPLELSFYEIMSIDADDVEFV